MKGDLNPCSTGAQMRLNETRDVSKAIQILMKTRIEPRLNGAQMRRNETRHVRNVIQICMKRRLNPGSTGAQMRLNETMKTRVKPGLNGGSKEAQRNERCHQSHTNIHEHAFEPWAQRGLE